MRVLIVSSICAAPIKRAKPDAGFFQQVLAQ